MLLQPKSQLRELSPEAGWGVGESGGDVVMGSRWEDRWEEVWDRLGWGSAVSPPAALLLRLVALEGRSGCVGWVEFPRRPHKFPKRRSDGLGTETGTLEAASAGFWGVTISRGSHLQKL